MSDCTIEVCFDDCLGSEQDTRWKDNFSHVTDELACRQESKQLDEMMKNFEYNRAQLYTASHDDSQEGLPSMKVNFIPFTIRILLHRKRLQEKRRTLLQLHYSMYVAEDKLSFTENDGDIEIFEFNLAKFYDDKKHNDWLLFDECNSRDSLLSMTVNERDGERLLKDVKMIAKVCMKYSYFIIIDDISDSHRIREARRLLAPMVLKYQMTAGLPNCSSLRDEVTKEMKCKLSFPKISSIVPLYCAHISETESTKPLGDKPAGLPRCLAFPSAPSLIPLEREDLYSSWLEWAISFNKITTHETNSEKVNTFGRMTQRSSYLTDAQKQDSLIKLGIRGK